MRGRSFDAIQFLTSTNAIAIHDIRDVPAVGDDMSQLCFTTSDGLGPNAEGESLRRATVARVTSNGVGYLTDEKSNRVHVFTFDKIARYKGEAASELGLKEGAHVRYKLNGHGGVCMVVSPGHPGRVKARRFSFA